MKKIKIPYADTEAFGPVIMDYLSGDKKLRPFYQYPPRADVFREVVENKSKTPINREVLTRAVNRQYQKCFTGLPATDPVLQNVNLLLLENTFTVTTGHQLNIFTGPLYTIYKILTVIKLAREIEDSDKNIRVVPVFWMASEDHDFEEISSINIFGNKIIWESDQQGAVGRMKTDGLSRVIREINSVFRENEMIPEFFEEAYRKSISVAEATRRIIHHLFGQYGVVIVDGDDPELKKIFIPELLTEINENLSCKTLNQSNQKFSENYKLQIQPRDINLFYMGKGFRERLVETESKNFEVLNTAISFSREELVEEINRYPDRFSPNVILRPLYQEKILPNLAYVGGPGEVHYWLQLKSVFDDFKVPFPVVMLRNSFLLLDRAASEKLNKVGIKASDLFQSADYLILKVLEQSTVYHPDTGHFIPEINRIYDQLKTQLSELEPTLEASVESEKQKVINGLNQLEAKARRALKKKNETVVNQVTSLKDRLFPGGKLQERVENIIPFMIQYPSIVESLLENTEPFTGNLAVLLMDE
jgi:bacillithiol synthase